MSFKDIKVKSLEESPIGEDKIISREDLEDLEPESATGAEMVSLGGWAKTKEGKITKSDYFRFLGHSLDDYSHIVLTAEEANQLSFYMHRLTTGTHATVPLRCAGAKCPFSKSCPLFKINKHPLGMACPIEDSLLQTIIAKLVEEYEVDPENYTEISYMNELAEIELVIHRINSELAKNESLLVDKVVTVSRDGDIITDKELSPLLDYKEKILSRKSKIHKLMVGDRQEKYKREAALKVKDTGDQSNKMSKIRNQIESLQSRLNTVETDTDKKEKSTQLTPDDFLDSLE